MNNLDWNAGEKRNRCRNHKFLCQQWQSNCGRFLTHPGLCRVNMMQLFDLYWQKDCKSWRVHDCNVKAGMSYFDKALGVNKTLKCHVNIPGTSCSSSSPAETLVVFSPSSKGSVVTPGWLWVDYFSLCPRRWPWLCWCCAWLGCMRERPGDTGPTSCSTRLQWPNR